VRRALLLIAPAAAEQPHFKPEDIEQGRALFQRTCSHCHGINMVNSGTAVYDLRRFPVDDPTRFLNSVTNGKGNMPSWKDALTPEQITTALGLCRQPRWQGALNAHPSILFPPRCAGGRCSSPAPQGRRT